MRLHAAAATLAACLVPAAAIFEDDAYHIDFHYALVGIPKPDSTFFQKPYAGSKASLLYTLSQNHTLGAVNPKDGALVWRQAPPPGAPSKSTLRAAEDQDIAISAVGDRITAWSASDGRVVWENRVHGAIVEDLEILEQEDGITNTEAKDAIVLLGGASSSVQRLDGKTGRAKWTFQDTRQATYAAIIRSCANSVVQR
jgi:outer membrane protein assembly factor BamB